MNSFLRALLAALLLAMLSVPPLGCVGIVSDETEVGDRPEPEPEPEPRLPDPDRPAPTSCDVFTPTPAFIHAAKVKNLLTGRPLTNEELTQLLESPEILSSFVDTWQGTDEADAKLLHFFKTAFQQEGFEEPALSAQWGENLFRTGMLQDERTNVSGLLRKNFEESFARTALEIVRAGRPFNEVVTTRSFMLTTAMLSTLSFVDERPVDDQGESSYRPMENTIRELAWHSDAPIPDTETLDPMSPNFMHFYVAGETAVPACAEGMITRRTPNGALLAYRAVFGFYSVFGPVGGCRGAAKKSRGLMRRADFEDWRMVTIETPADPTPTRFFDLPNLRAATVLNMHAPRVGFFTTPAFFAVWETNTDNDGRVTANQTLITAFAQSIDDSQVILPAFEDALDGAHANPSTSCYGCHKTLDPLRQFFRREYTYTGGLQEDDAVRTIRPAFAWDGVEATSSDIYGFAEVLATHPQFPRGWVQKMCFYANSRACPEDAEFDRIVQAFVSSGLDFRVMTRELFSSPLVTNATCIQEGSGDNAGISRGRHFCAAISNRLEIEDACGQELIFPEQKTPLRERNSPLFSSIPDDAFSRGDHNPLTVSDTNLFIRGTYERICMNLAEELVKESEGRFSPTDVEGALTFFVEQLMGFPASDPRSARAHEILRDHLEEANEAEDDEVAALQSTFVLSCLSPSMIGIGL